QVGGGTNLATYVRNPTDIQFAPDGTFYVAGDRTGGRAVYQFDPATGDELREFDVSSSTGVTTDHFAISQDGNLYYFDPTTGAVPRYNLATGELLGTFVPGGVITTTSGYLLPLYPQG